MLLALAISIYDVPNDKVVIEVCDKVCHRLLVKKDELESVKVEELILKINKGETNASVR